MESVDGLKISKIFSHLKNVSLVLRNRKASNPHYPFTTRQLQHADTWMSCMQGSGHIWPNFARIAWIIVDVSMPFVNSPWEVIRESLDSSTLNLLVTLGPEVVFAPVSDATSLWAMVSDDLMICRMIFWSVCDRERRLKKWRAPISV